MNDGALFTEAFLKALGVSCAWWLFQGPPVLLWGRQQNESWLSFCKEVVSASPLTPQHLKKCMDKYLEINTQHDAFFTGYYEPTLYGSLHKTEKFSHPLYKDPKKHQYPHAFSRKDIYKGALFHQNLELLYVSNPIDAFFLEIQGSGRVVLDDGRILRVGYDGQNGKPYTPIGRILVERGEISKDAVTLFSIKKWLLDHPKNAWDIMEHNESYVYFKILEENDSDIDGPLGTQKLPLTPLHSVACDASHWPFGMILSYDIPFEFHSEFQRSQKSLRGYALTQDTGGAIKGNHRFDLFCGAEKEGEYMAGHLKHPGKVIFWVPKKHA